MTRGITQVPRQGSKNPWDSICPWASRLASFCGWHLVSHHRLARHRPSWPTFGPSGLRELRLGGCRSLGKKHILSRLASVPTPTWRHPLFLFPKQAQDNVKSVRLLQKEVLQNVSVIQPWGRTGPPSEGAGVPWVGLSSHRTGWQEGREVHVLGHHPSTWFMGV